MTEKTQDKRIMIIFHSIYGHIEKLAREILIGVNSIPGLKGELWRVEETLSDEILKKMGAHKKSDDVPILTYSNLTQITTADGFIFGTPTRYGMMSAQMKAFWDMTGGLWVKGALVGKPAAIFFSTGTQGGGQETTALTFLTQFAHHGMVFVPLGYTFGNELFSFDSIRGGSPYGAGTFAGADGSRVPSELELAIARHQGSHFAKFVNRLV